MFHLDSNNLILHPVTIKVVLKLFDDYSKNGLKLFGFRDSHYINPLGQANAGAFKNPSIPANGLSSSIYAFIGTSLLLVFT